MATASGGGRDADTAGGRVGAAGGCGIVVVRYRIPAIENIVVLNSDAKHSTPAGSGYAGTQQTLAYEAGGFATALIAT